MSNLALTWIPWPKQSLWILGGFIAVSAVVVTVALVTRKRGGK